jgi:hypothetical protein
MPQTKAANGKTQTPIKKATSKTTRAATVTQEDVAVAEKAIQRIATRNAIIADTAKAKTYKAMKAMKVGNNTYAIGDIVTEAPNWLRLESWIMARWVEEV